MFSASRLIVGIAAPLLPHAFLRLGIVGDGEGHDAFEIEVAFPVGGDDLAADIGELEPLADDERRHAEPGGDIVLAHAAIGQRLEGVELIGGVHGVADFIFGKADLDRVLAVQHVARHGMIVLDLLALGEQFERGVPPPSGDDFELAIRCGLDLHVLQQAVRLDAGGKLLDAVAAVGLAHIGGGGDELR